MKILVLNGSPRKNGVVVTLLRLLTEQFKTSHEVEWVDTFNLNIKYCKACMACREKGICVLPEDDAHITGKKIQQADALIVGTPTHWGNMSAPLKLLFDRNVPIFMGESPRGIPIPKQKGKPAVIVTACTTPWPFNFILPESRGAIRAVKEVLKSGGYKIIGTMAQAGTKRAKSVPSSLEEKAIMIGRKMIKDLKVKSDIFSNDY